MRLGWIQANDAMIRQMLASGAIVSGGCFNHFGSHVVRQLLEDGSLADLLAELRREYGTRVDAMDQALREHFGNVATWRKPRSRHPRTCPARRAPPLVIAEIVTLRADCASRGGAWELGASGIGWISRCPRAGHRRSVRSE